MEKLPNRNNLRVLEVGSGTGAVQRAFEREFPRRFSFITGIDSDLDSLRYAKNEMVEPLCNATGEDLPFRDNSFDFVFCHFLLLWVKDPVQVLMEMRRVTVLSGICTAIAEPCYADMLAEPDGLNAFAAFQREKLISAGINSETGRMLETYFLQAGFEKPISDRYQTRPLSPSDFYKELGQMREDCGSYEFVPQTGVKYSYEVPTYYAFAMK